MFLSLFGDKRAAVAVGCSMPFCQILELEDGEIIWWIIMMALCYLAPLAFSFLLLYRPAQVWFAYIYNSLCLLDGLHRPRILDQGGHRRCEEFWCCHSQWACLFFLICTLRGCYIFHWEWRLVDGLGTLKRSGSIVLVRAIFGRGRLTGREGELWHLQEDSYCRTITSISCCCFFCCLLLSLFWNAKWSLNVGSLPALLGHMVGRTSSLHFG